MSWPRNPAAQILIIVFLIIFACPLTTPASQAVKGDKLTVSGIVADAQGKGIRETEIELLVNGKHAPPVGASKPAVKAPLSGVIPYPRAPCRRLKCKFGR